MYIHIHYYKTKVEDGDEKKDSLSFIITMNHTHCTVTRQPAVHPYKQTKKETDNCIISGKSSVVFMKAGDAAGPIFS